MFYKSFLCINLFIASLLVACSENSPIHTVDLSHIEPAPTLKQHIVDIHKTSTGGLNTEDLARFAEQIGDARIIGLGEQTHGVSEVFTLKSQLIQYLHQEHGFDVFLLESGMYEINALWEKAKEQHAIKDSATGNIFYMYANSKELFPLFDYINQHANTEKPLIFSGFDSQHTGELSNKNLIIDLEHALTDRSYKFSEIWPQFKFHLQDVLNVSTQRLPINDEHSFFEELSNIQQVFSEARPQSNQQTTQTENRVTFNQDGFWFRITRGLEAQAKRQWGIADVRSQEMGKNIEWWAKQYPDKKIIVWAHSGHLYRTGYQQINAGQVISESFGDKYYMVHFTSKSGQFLNFIDMNIKNVSPTNENSFEQIVTHLNKSDLIQLSFVNIEPNTLLTTELSNEKMGLYAHDYHTVLPVNQWRDYIDGVFIFNKITPANYH